MSQGNKRKNASHAPTAGVVVRFRLPSQTAVVNMAGTIGVGDGVVVEQDNDSLLGRVTGFSNTAQKAPDITARLATAADEATAVRHSKQEQDALKFCQERLQALGLEMKLIAAEITHSGKRALFYFSSSARVDFRTLVRDLARRYHMRIEMRQIGVRDAAQHIGGIGICGQQTCCSKFLPKFEPVSIRMAKAQNLALNQEKLSGVCGRLRCCLQYEHDLYEEKRKALPKVGKQVMTPQGMGRVRDINVLKQRVRVQLASGGYADFDGPELSRATNDG